MKGSVIVSILVGVGSLALFTVLLVKGLIGAASYVLLLVPLALLCIALLGFPRLREIDFKNLKLNLDELKQVKSEIEIVKAEIIEMYGGIENLHRAPLVLDEKKMGELGLGPKGVALGDAVMRYCAGCIKRERERLARIFISPKPPKELAEAILDGSLDDKVFKWNGPESPLDAEPKSVEQRKQPKEAPQE